MEPIQPVAGQNLAKFILQKNEAFFIYFLIKTPAVGFAAD